MSYSSFQAASPCWVSQQLAHMLRREEEEEGAGRDTYHHLHMADKHREMNRNLFLPDRYMIIEEG